MLTRGSVTLAAALVTIAVAAAPAAADDLVNVGRTGGGQGDSGSVVIHPVDETTRPGTSGRAGSTSAGVRKAGNRTCTYSGEPVDCTSSTGVWSQEQQCWVQRISPQPPASDPIWSGREGGSVYWCETPPGIAGVMPAGSHMFWAPSAGAAGAPVLVDPVTLAEEAIDRMNLRAIQVGITPPEGPDSYTLVGIPTWLWVDEPDPVTWGPITRTASAGSVSVTATAKVASVVWDMGDATVVSCGKGTAYQDAFGADESPTCGHRYAAPGRYPVTATSNWTVDWSGAGQAGTITFTLTRDASVWVREALGLISQQG